MDTTVNYDTLEDLLVGMVPGVDYELPSGTIESDPDRIKPTYTLEDLLVGMVPGVDYQRN